VLLTLICIWLGKISVEARQQKEAVAWVKEHLGTVHYDWQLLDALAKKPKGLEPPGPRWLRKLIGDDFFQTAEAVWITDVDIDDLSQLADLTDLKQLSLIGNRLRDVEPLASLTKLRRLELSVNEIRDISPLFGLKDLTYLNLKGNPVNEGQLRELTAQVEGLQSGSAERDGRIKAIMQVRPLIR
jgi:hypothetical protein